jgi:hypothetical protein
MSSTTTSLGPQLYRAQIRDAIVTALRNAQTLAGADVYAPRDWPETIVELPAIIVSMPSDHKENTGPFGPRYNTTATIVVLGRLKGQTAIDAEAQLEAFANQIQNAILTDLATLSLVEKFSTIDTETAITDNGEDQIGEISIAFGADFYEIFQPGIGLPASIMGTIQIGTQELEIKPNLG